MWITDQENEQKITLAAAFILTAIGTGYMSPIIYQNRSLRIGITKKFFRHIAYTNLIISILSTISSSIMNKHLLTHSRLCSSCPLASDILLALAIICIFLRMTIEQYGDLMKTIQRNQVPFLLRRRVIYPIVILSCSICISFYGNNDNSSLSRVDQVSNLQDDQDATSSCHTIWTIFLKHTNSNSSSQSYIEWITMVTNSISDDTYQRVKELSQPLWRATIIFTITSLVIYMGYNWILSTVWIKARRHSLISVTKNMRKQSKSSRKSSKWQLLYLIDRFGNQLNKFYIDLTDEYSAHFYLPFLLKSSLIWIPLRLWYVMTLMKRSAYFLPGDMPAVVSWVCLSMTICSPFGYCFSGDRKHFKNRLWDVMGLIRDEKKIKFADEHNDDRHLQASKDPSSNHRCTSNKSLTNTPDVQNTSLDSPDSTSTPNGDGKKIRKKCVQFNTSVETIGYVEKDDSSSEDGGLIYE